MIDLPPAILHDEVPRHCFSVVVSAYQLQPSLLGGILYVEGGRNGMANLNKNGSYDYGAAQINSSWLEKTKEIGIDAEQLKNDTCKNLWTAGWILRRCLNKFNGSFWDGVGCYHTGESPKKPEQLARQKQYALKVYKAAHKVEASLARWLAGASPK